MNVVAFHGSPRVGGNTDLLLGETLKPIYDGGHDVVLFRLNLMNIKPCQNCGGCEETGICVNHDDMEKIYGAIRGADRVIIASPVFFLGLSAQTKIMIDRCQAFWCEKYLLKREISGGQYGRKGLLLIAGGMKKEIGISCSEATAKAFFRSISAPEHETLGFLGIEHKGAILDHPTALSDAYTAGVKLVGL
ncbi:MAG: flavodoxin family protein [Proteobacteria bacterium]|nr:flavodoxin family protein [Pseudomonadota bacterium]